MEIMRGPRFGNLAWKITKEDGFPVWASKLERGPSAAGQPGGFLGLGLKTEDGARCGRVARRVWWFGLKTITDEGFPVLTQNRGPGLA